MYMVKRVARVIAKENGDDYDSIPASKSDWTRNGGMFGGRFRDVNEPYQTDYDDMARAAIEAMREPTNAMVDRVEDAYGGLSTLTVQYVWSAMIDAALGENG